MNLSRISEMTYLKINHRFTTLEALIRLQLTVNAVCSQRWGSLRGSTSYLTRWSRGSRPLC